MCPISAEHSTSPAVVVECSQDHHLYVLPALSEFELEAGGPPMELGYCVVHPKADPKHRSRIGKVQAPWPPVDTRLEGWPELVMEGFTTNALAAARILFAQRTQAAPEAPSSV